MGVDLFGIANWQRTLESIPKWWESQRVALYKEIGDPEKDEQFESNGAKFTVLDAEPQKVNRVRIELTPQPAEEMAAPQGM